MKSKKGVAGVTPQGLPLARVAPHAALFFGGASTSSCMVAEEVNTMYLPFIGETEIDGVGGLLMLVLGIVGGSAIWQMGEKTGNTVANTVLSGIGNLTGFNPATGSSEGPEGV